MYLFDAFVDFYYTYDAVIMQDNMTEIIIVFKT